MLSFFNIDFLQLLLSMYISHTLLGTPLYGGAVFIFANILIISQKDSIKKIIGFYKSTLITILLIVAEISGIALILFYPSFINYSRINSAIFLIIIMLARNFFNSKLITYFKDWKIKKIIIIEILFQTFAAGGMFWASQRCLSGINLLYVMILFVITGLIPLFIKKVEPVEYERSDMGIASYKTFFNMMYYSRLALMTGILMIIAYLSFRQTESVISTYIIMFLWLLVIAVLYTINNLIIKPNQKLNISMFIVGAIAWIAGTISFFHDISTVMDIVFLLLFALGLSLINGSITRFNNDFLLVLKFIGEDHIESRIRATNIVNNLLASLTANCIMLIITTIWCFIIPEFKSEDASVLFNGLIIQIPVIFMILSVYFALNQPLDARTKEKLTHYLTVTPNSDTTSNIYKLLVKKYRTRYGIKIIATFIKPWLHLKVYGIENIRQNEFPSIFVCNHGIIYGPIAAVLYLPTYFRPWIDRKMLYIDLAADEMYRRFMYRIPLFSEKAKRKMAKWLARPVTWALKSFNPIAVERDDLRKVMKTFNDTIQALKESDNILLFPEKPAKVIISGKETIIHTTDSVGNLFTGFAKLGSMYWAECKKKLSFYPIYADKSDRTFRIGEPVVYDPDNCPKAEKKRIVEELKKKMIELQKL